MNVNICMPVFVTRVVAAAVTVLALTGAAGAAEWITDANGNWNDDANWANPATFPNGADSVADFSLLDITANRTITLGQNITVGTMTIGDTNDSSDYTFSGNTLTFNGTGGATLTSVSNTANQNNFLSNVALGSNLDVKVNGTGRLNVGTKGAFSLGDFTLTNSGTGTGQFRIQSVGTGQDVFFTGSASSRIIQDSATSTLLIGTETGTGAGFAGETIIKKGRLLYTSQRQDTLGTTRPITIGNSAGGSDDAVFQVNVSSTWSYAFANPIVVAANSTGTLTLRVNNTANRSVQFRGGVTGDNSLTIENWSTGNFSFTDNVSPESLNFSGMLTHIGDGTGSATINQVIGTNVTGVTQNSGTSRLILNAANTYAGPTAVTAGTLTLGASGSISTSSAISVASGATFNVSAVTGFALGSAQTLGGSGTVTGAVSLTSTGSILSPGASPGILSFDTTQTWDAFSYEWEVNDWTGTTPGTAFDQIAITGSLDLSSGTAYQLDLLSLDAGNASGQVPNFAETARSWTILTTTGGITGFNASLWTIGTSGFSSSPTATGTFSLATGNGGQDLVLSYSPVPEPAAVGLLGVAGLCAGFGLARQRRRAGFPFGQ